MKKIFPSIISFLLIATFAASIAYAADPPGSGSGGGRPGSGSGGGPQGSVEVEQTLNNPIKLSVGNTLPEFLESLLRNVILPIGEVLIVLMFIYTGFMFVMAQGKPAKIDEAKRALLYTSIGTAVLLGAWGIAQVLKNTVNQVIAP